MTICSTILGTTEVTYIVLTLCTIIAVLAIYLSFIKRKV